MDKSNRRQTIQAIVLLIGLLTFFGIIFTLTGCSPNRTDVSGTFSVKERAYLSDVGPVLSTNVETATQMSSVIAIGKTSCQQRDAGVSTDDIIANLVSDWTELEARVMVNSAEKYFCK